MILRESTPGCEPARNVAALLIADGDPVPKAGDIIWYQMKAKKIRIQIVEKQREIRMHKRTMYVFSFRRAT